MGFWTDREQAEPGSVVYSGETGRQDDFARATPKHQIEKRVVTREKTRAAKKLNAKTMREAVWARDGGKCRATGVPLVKSGTTDDKKLGEVDHTLLRSTDPDKVYDPGNGVLLQKFLNRLRKAVCRNDPQYRMFDYVAVNEGDEDRGHDQKFIWRDENGTVTKTRIG